LVVGLLGIVRGIQMAKRRGPDVLMHYPAPLFWLRGRLTAARWVQWIGRLYCLAAVVLMTMAFSLGLQSKTDPHSPLCAQLGEAISESEIAGTDWRVQDTGSHTDGCHIQIVGADGTRWFSIRSSGADTLIGEGYRHQTRELERSGMALKPVTGLGNRALIATSRAKGLANPILIIEDARGIHSVEMNGLNINKSQRAFVIETVRNSLGATSR